MEKGRFNPGGSSSGTGSAVGTGQLFGATGSCTGGSIRAPAAWCGICGIKPTYGLVSKRGGYPLSKTLDHAGPLCRSALDCALFLNAMKGYDPQDPDSLRAPEPNEDLTASIDQPIAGLKLA